MSWECRYNVQNYCQRLKRECEPGIKGCILYGKVTFYDKPDEESKNKDSEDQEKRNS